MGLEAGFCPQAVIGFQSLYVNRESRIANRESRIANRVLDSGVKGLFGIFT